MERKRLTFEGKNVYIYSFTDHECSNKLWTVQEIDPEVLRVALLEIAEISRKQDMSCRETIWDNEKNIEIPNPEFDPKHAEKPYIFWVDLLHEKFGMNQFSTDYTANEPDGWDQPGYQPNIKKVEPGDYGY